MPSATSPEIHRTPLDEMLLQICLLYEQRRDKHITSGNEPQRDSKGVSPMRFLGKTPEPPPEESVVAACCHLLEVGALTVTCHGPPILYRLTPLGYQLSRLPMDAKVGKVLIVGCMLQVLDNALTIAAALSINRSCFEPRTNQVKADWDTIIQRITFKKKKSQQHFSPVSRLRENLHAFS